MTICTNAQLKPVPCRKQILPFVRSQYIPKLCIGTIAFCSSLVAPSFAVEPQQVAEFNASGLVFKDSVEVVSVEDPDIPGVTLYLSDFRRSFADKLSKMDFANEPSQASVTCAATGPIIVPDLQAISGSQGKEVFSETRSRSLLIFGNKTLRVRRILDSNHSTLVYVAYSTRINSAGEDGRVSAARYRTSLCVVPFLSNAPNLKN